MRKLGPLVTLGAGVVLAGGIAVMNLQPGPTAAGTVAAASAPAASATAAAAATDAATAPATPPPTTAAAAPTEAAAAADPAAPPTDYAGRVTGGKAALAVSIQGGKAVAYLCDGKTIEAWMYGTAGEDGSVDLTGKSGATLKGKRANGHITGTVTADGRSWEFDVAKTAKPGALYRATGTAAGKQLRAGWVVLPDGQQTGIVNRGGTPGPAPALDATSGRTTVDGTQLTASPVSPSTSGAEDF